MPGHYYDAYRILQDLYTTHPSKRQWELQQNAASLPVAGSLYRDWMVGRSTNERNDYTRDLYGINWDDIKYPWLSGVTNTNPTARAVGSMVSTAIPSIMRIYGNDKKDNEHRKRKIRPQDVDDWAKAQMRKHGF